MATLWHGGTIYTMDAEDDKVEALLVEDGKIIAIGEKLLLQPHAQQEVDLAGGVLYPGFVDSHIHLIGYGEKLMHLDVSHMTSKQQMMHAIRERMQQVAPDDWVIVIGYYEAQFDDDTFPTLQELHALGDAHLVIKRRCHHLIIANQKALDFAGITAHTPAPAGGIIDTCDGKLTGVLKDAALYMIVNHMPHLTLAYVQKALQLAIESLLTMGVTGAHSEDLSYFGPPTQPLQAFQAIVPNRFKAHLLQHHTVFEEANEWPSTPFIEMGAMKIFVDGAFGGHTAALHKPYDDKDTTGMLVHTTKQLYHLVKQARLAKREVAVHVIGDRAIDTILDVFAIFPPVYHWQHDRIIHSSLVNDTIIKRLANMPVIIDFQPQFVEEPQAVMLHKLGDNRCRYLHLCKTFITEGITVAGGSDAPIEHPNPLHAMYAAMTRRYQDEDAQQPEECLTRYEAVTLFTKNAAKAIHKEQSRGRIAIGYEADFTILKQDIFTVPLREIPHIAVQMTVVDGQIVYDSRMSEYEKMSR